MTRDTRDPRALLPLTPLAFHVLLALADRPRHGYAVIQEVAERTGGMVTLRTGTLYTLLQRLLAETLIEPEGRADQEDPSGRRRHYRLTPFGRSVVQAEARRLETLVIEARDKRVLGRASRA